MVPYLCSILTLLSMVLATEVSCIKKTSGTITPMEKITAYNASLADTNNTVAQGLMALVASKVLSPQAAQPALAWTSQVATDHLQFTAILETASQSPSGQITASQYSQMQLVVAQIGQSAQTLINSGGLGIKNPNSQQTVSADVQSIVNLANAILQLAVTITAPPAVPAPAPTSPSTVPLKGVAGSYMWVEPNVHDYSMPIYLLSPHFAAFRNYSREVKSL